MVAYMVAVLAQDMGAVASVQSYGITYGSSGGGGEGGGGVVWGDAWEG